jgi:hypothetical protein
VYKVGDLVLAMWPPDGSWHEAAVTHVLKNEITVVYKNDGWERKLKNFQIKVGATFY